MRMSHVKRIVATAIIIGGAATGIAVTTGATSAFAATQYENVFWDDYGLGAQAKAFCQEEAFDFNMLYYQSEHGSQDGQSYFYCVQEANAHYADWWRRPVG